MHYVTWTKYLLLGHDQEEEYVHQEKRPRFLLIFIQDGRPLNRDWSQPLT